MLKESLLSQVLDGTLKDNKKHIKWRILKMITIPYVVVFIIGAISGVIGYYVRRHD